MTKDEWRKIIEEQKKSGMTADAFCRERGINRTTFSVNKSALRDEGKFVPVGAKKPVEVVLTNGITIRCEASELPTVLKAIHA